MRRVLRLTHESAQVTEALRCRAARHAQHETDLMPSSISGISGYRGCIVQQRPAGGRGDFAIRGVGFDNEYGDDSIAQCSHLGHESAANGGCLPSPVILRARAATDVTQPEPLH